MFQMYSNNYQLYNIPCFNEVVCKSQCLMCTGYRDKDTTCYNVPYFAERINFNPHII